MAPGSSRQSPDVVAAANQAQIEKLERAIGVLGEDNVDAAGLVATLKRLRTQTTQPVGERLDACQQFVERAKKRLAAAEQAVTKALETKSRLEAELSEGMQRLQRLREEAVASALVDHHQGAPRATEVPPTVPASSAAEINQLRAQVEELRRERDLLASRQQAEDQPVDQSLVMSPLTDYGDGLRRGANRFNPLS